MTTDLRYNQVKYHIKAFQIKTNKTQMVVHNTTSKISYIYLPGEQRGELQIPFKKSTPRKKRNCSQFQVAFMNNLLIYLEVI